MTCAHVLGLIDAGPFADYPRAHLDAAWNHAGQCATCGPALRAAAALTKDLAGLPQPAPPPELAATVLARIARIEEPHTAPAAAATRDWPLWAAAIAGLVIVVSMPEVGVMASHTIASTETAMPLLMLGVVLYVAGLFMPPGEEHNETITASRSQHG